MSVVERFFPYFVRQPHVRIMIFIDGENLAIRYDNKIGEDIPKEHIRREKGVYLWSFNIAMVAASVNVIRTYYYTSVMGDDQKVSGVIDQLKEAHVDKPRVYKKSRTKGSKQVDIALCVDMLTNAHRNNYDVAVLIAGDEDYVPLVEAVQAEGKRVFVWFLDNGLSPLLRRAADRFEDLGILLFSEEDPFSISDDRFGTAK